MNADLSRAARVGLLLIVVTAVLVSLLLQVSSRSGIFHRTTSYRTRFTTIQGLAEGAEVRYKGVNVGKVETITFSDDPADDSILVQMEVERDLAARLDRHVRAELKSDGPLGAKLIELRRPDIPVEEPLVEGAWIESRPPLQLTEMMEGGADLFANIKSISESLAIITNRLVAGEGLFGRLLKDKDFGDRTLTNLEESLARLRQILDGAAEGKGLAGALLTNERLAQQVTTELTDSIANLQSISARIERGEGVLGQALRDDSELSRAASDFARAAAGMRTLSERLSSSEGLVSRLVSDPELAAKIAADLEATSGHVRSITRKLDEGEGTAGQFLNDPALYDNVNDIVRGIQKSWFIGTILKSKQKKGYEERVERILRESPTPNADLVKLLAEVLGEDPGPRAPSPASPEPAP